MPVAKYKTTVSKVIHETPTVVLLRLKFDGGVPFTFKSGQYIHVILEKDEKLIYKPYSITSAPQEKNYIELCVKRVEGGFASNYLCDLKGGETITIMGPIGIFILKEPLTKEIFFVATGSGISAPLSMILDLLNSKFKEKIALVFGNRTEDEIIYRKLLEKLEKENDNFKVYNVLSRPDSNWKGSVGHVQDVLQKIIKDPQNSDVYICGVVAMVEEVSKWAESIGFSRQKIHFEKYT